jgi:hypothetical protein
MGYRLQLYMQYIKYCLIFWESKSPIPIHHPPSTSCKVYNKFLIGGQFVSKPVSQF